jgi:hypothetical protein
MGLEMVAVVEDIETLVGLEATVVLVVRQEGVEVVQEVPILLEAQLEERGQGEKYEYIHGRR